jgi:hypothetical protein
MLKGASLKIHYMTGDMQRIADEKKEALQQLHTLQKQYEGSKKHQEHRIDEA